MWGNHIILFLLFAGLLTNWFEPLDAFVRRSDFYPLKCTLPKKTGVCKAAFRRYFFNIDTKECERFIYGGCRPNENNFRDLSECSLECRKVEDLPQVCRRPKYVGRCKASFPRFYYNVETRTCESFIFGGCRSNGNNFVSVTDCLMTCENDAGW